MNEKFTLNKNDIKGMISSALLAEMDYGKKLAHTCSGELSETFIPSGNNLPDTDRILERIALQFGFKAFGELKGLTIAEMASHILSFCTGRPEKLTFFTSGSTGTPVPNASYLELLEQEVLALVKLFPRGKRIVSLVPRHHIYGFLFSVLLPKVLDIPANHVPPMPTVGMLKSLRDGDLVIAFPLLWTRLEQLRHPFSQNIRGVTSTGPCPADVIKKLCSLGLESMTEVYGSSETGGVGYRSNPDNYYTLLPHWRKKEPHELERQKTDHSGFITYTLQDSLEWQDEKHFKPLHRKDKAVQVAGVNVYPSKIKAFFCALEKVSQCSIRLMTPDEGDRLKIFIVPSAEAKETSSAELEKILREAAGAYLTPPERPGSYTFGDILPRTTMGKLTNW